MSLLDNFDQIVARPQIRGVRHNLALIDAVDGNNTSSAVIPYGSIVVIDESVTSSLDYNNPPVKLIAADDEIVVGLAFLEYTHEEAQAVGGEYGYPPLAQLPIAKQGEFKVFSETANAYGDPVYVRVASGVGGDKVGFAFRNAAVTDETLLLPNAYWVKKNAGTNEISAIRIRF